MTEPGRTPTSTTTRPAQRRPGSNRFLLLVVCAMALGYFVANRVPELFKDKKAVTREFEIMNTYAVVTIPEKSGSRDTPKELADAAESAIRRINTLMSPFGDASDVKRLNDTPAGTWVKVDPLTWKVVMESLRWHRLSGGAFDPTIGPIKALFKFNKEDAVSWPDDGTLARARARVGAEKLRYDREGMRLMWTVDGMRLDLGAIAKGFAADHAADALRRRGVVNALVNIGGELRVLGRKPGAPETPWRAGIQHPRRDDEMLERLDLEDCAVATSGDYERYFVYDGKRYEHIIDPRTGVPLSDGPASVTIIHPDSCLAADALATTMCVLGPEEGEEFIRSQALGLFANGVKIVMLTPEGEGIHRIDFVVETNGDVTVTRSRL